MSLKFLSRLRDKDKSPVKSKPLPSVPPAGISAPRTGTEIDASEIQVISWNSETDKHAYSGLMVVDRDHDVRNSPRTPLYEAFTQRRPDNHSSASSEAGPSRHNNAQSPSASVLERPRVAPRREPEVLNRVVRSPSVGDPREELRSSHGACANDDGAATPKRGGIWSQPKRRADAPARTKRPMTAGDSSRAFYRSDTVQSTESAISLTSVGDDGDCTSKPKGRKGSFGGLAKKPSMNFFRKAKSPSTDSAISATSGSSGDDPRPVVPPRRSRSSSLTSLSPATFHLRSKEKPPSLPTSHHIFTGGSVGRTGSDNRAPSSWKPATVSNDTSPYLSSAYTSETDLAVSSSSKESGDVQSRQRSRAKSAIARARSIKRAAAAATGTLSAKGASEEAGAAEASIASEPSTSSMPPVPPVPSGLPAAREVENDSAVRITSPGLPTAALPLGASPARAQNESLHGLLATKLFQQLGPPPNGFEVSAFEKRVDTVIEYIRSRAIAIADSSVDTHQAPPSPRSSLPPMSKQQPPLRRGLSAASAEDEFDKLECQVEEEVLQSIARGAYDQSSVEILHLDAVFLEARRRCGVGHSRTHFQLFAGGPSTSSPLLAPDARGWATSTSLGTSPRVATLGMGGAINGDTLSGLGAPLRPAPRRKKRPTTAPEAPSALMAGGQLPPSPPPPRFGANGGGFTPAAGCFQRSPAPSLQSMQASDDSHDLNHTSRDGHGLGFDIPRSGFGGIESGGKTAAGLFTPQSFSTKPPTSAGSSSDHHHGSSRGGSHATSSRQLTFAPHVIAPPPLSVAAFGPTPGANFYRRGSSDRESNSSHTTRSVRSPMMASYGRWSSRYSAGTRNSQDTNETADTSESTLAGGVGLISMDSPMTAGGSGADKIAERV